MAKEFICCPHTSRTKRGFDGICGACAKAVEAGTKTIIRPSNSCAVTRTHSIASTVAMLKADGIKLDPKLLSKETDARIKEADDWAGRWGNEGGPAPPAWLAKLLGPRKAGHMAVGWGADG